MLVISDTYNQNIYVCRHTQINKLFVQEMTYLRSFSGQGMGPRPSKYAY